jgi:hypothetical protein
MAMSEEENDILIPPANYSKIVIIAIVTVIALTLITVGAYQMAKKRSPVVVLPGGITYLGPSIGPTSPPAPPVASKFTAPENTPWNIYKGKKQPFSFSYPNTLKLVSFPDDITESVAFSFNNIPPQNNIMFRLSIIREIEPKMVEYINKPKIEYVKNWWTQYTGGLKGVASVVEFTNSRGMKGYKAKYKNHADQTPNDDVFFEVPGHADYMVRFGNGQLDSEIFNKIVDTFYWGKIVEPSRTPTETKTE